MSLSSSLLNDALPPSSSSSFSNFARVGSFSGPGALPSLTCCLTSLEANTALNKFVPLPADCITGWDLSEHCLISLSNLHDQAAEIPTALWIGAKRQVKIILNGHNIALKLLSRPIVGQ